MSRHARVNTQQLTYNCDRLRAPFFGVLEAGWITFGLLVAIRVYDAPESVKAILSAAGFVGLLINTFSIAWIARKQWQPSHTIFGFLLATAAFLLLAACWPGMWPFALFFILARVLYSQQSPLATHIYTHNYAPHERGSKVSTAFMLIAVGGTAASMIGGNILDQHIDLYPLYFITMALSAIIAGLLIRMIPSTPLSIKDTASPWQNLSLLWHDRLFAWMLFCWMLMGFGNLITVPLRVEVMANPDYGINASNGQIATITFVIPSIMRILSGKIWGMLFDRMHFITWRILINVCFVIGFLLFFYAGNLILLGVGTAFLGVAMGGGFLAWNLWVTRIAPSAKVSAYMSVHTALTGIRGVLAPFVGYLLLTHTTPQFVAWVCSTLVIVASILFVFARRSSRLQTQI